MFFEEFQRLICLIVSKMINGRVFWYYINLSFERFVEVTAFF